MRRGVLTLLHRQPEKFAGAGDVVLDEEVEPLVEGQPLAQLADLCVPVWGDREQLNAVLLGGFSSIPYCTYLYTVDTDAVQISDNIGKAGIVSGHYQRNRAERPYMQETVPAWGFLLSDAYISLDARRPSLTALQIVATEAGTDLATDDSDYTTWFRGQVLHPYETQHTLAEVADVLREEGFRIAATSFDNFKRHSDVASHISREHTWQQKAERALAKGRYFPGYFVVWAQRG